MSRKVRKSYPNVLNVVVNGTSIGMTRSPDEAAEWLGKSSSVEIAPATVIDRKVVSGVPFNEKRIIDTGVVDYYVPAAKV